MNSAATVDTHWITQGSWSAWELAHTGRSQLPVPQCPSLQPAMVHYLSLWHLKMKSQCQAGSFPNQFKEQNPLITTGSSKENKEGIHERKRMTNINRKIHQRKTRRPENILLLHVLAKRAKGVGRRLTHMSEPVHCSLSQKNIGDVSVFFHNCIALLIKTLFFGKGVLMSFTLYCEDRDRLPCHYPI